VTYAKAVGALLGGRAAALLVGVVVLWSEYPFPFAIDVDGVNGAVFFGGFAGERVVVAEP
jgi:hypothetical protein